MKELCQIKHNNHNIKVFKTTYQDGSLAIMSYTEGEPYSDVSTNLRDGLEGAIWVKESSVNQEISEVLVEKGFLSCTSESETSGFNRYTKYLIN